jgi:hypothetical protein
MPPGSEINSPLQQQPDELAEDPCSLRLQLQVHMDVQRYQQLRRFGRRLMSVLTKTIPREAMMEMGNALGIMRENTLGSLNNRNEKPATSHRSQRSVPVRER